MGRPSTVRSCDSSKKPEKIPEHECHGCEKFQSGGHVAVFSITVDDSGRVVEDGSSYILPGQRLGTVSHASGKPTEYDEGAQDEQPRDAQDGPGQALSQPGLKSQYFDDDNGEYCCEEVSVDLDKKEVRSPRGFLLRWV